MTQRQYAKAFFSFVSIAAIGLMLGLFGLEAGSSRTVWVAAVLYLGGAAAAIGTLLNGGRCEAKRHRDVLSRLRQ